MKRIKMDRKRILKYFGEFVLIFTSITLAIAIENLNEERKEQQTEKSMLMEMKVSLEQDIHDLEFNLSYDSITNVCIHKVLDHMDQNKPYEDTLNYYFGRMTGISGFLPNYSVYENLKSIGLDLISNDSLRAKITYHYEYRTKFTTTVQDVYVIENQINVINTQMIPKFNYQFVFKPAMPINYTELLEDKEFISAIQTKLEIQTWKTQLIIRQIDEINSLKNLIEKELVNLE